jgi:hypothetical protein
MQLLLIQHFTELNQKVSNFLFQSKIKKPNRITINRLSLLVILLGVWI